MQKIIAIMGVAGSGKTVVSKRLVERHGFRRTRFAGGIKAMLKVGLGLTDEELDGNEKMKPIPDYHGHTARSLMQTLGTSWGRQTIHPDIWANAWKREAERLGGLIVVDDLRFPNEAAAVRDMGGVIWRIYRPGLNSMDHVSERAQAGIREDILITNATTLSGLDLSIDAAARTFLGASHV